jgi:ribosomal protein L10
MSLKIQRVRKEFLVGRVTERVKRSALVAVAHVGNLNISDRTLVRRSLTDAGGDVTFVKNSLTAKGLEAAGAHDLAPLLRGNTLLATGPDEVPIAAALHSLSKSVPNFVVLGALLNSRQRILQVRATERT